MERDITISKPNRTTFWHVGLEKIVVGSTKEMKVVIGKAYIVIHWMDPSLKCIVSTTVHQSNILDFELL